MAVDSARYELIDPLAKGPEAIRRAFENQVAYCRDNDAPVTANVCQALLDVLDSTRGGSVMLRVRGWAGAPLADALPLRLAGGLHALHLAGEEPMLAPIYEGHRVSDFSSIIADTIERHEAFLLPWLDSPPQTNEAGRSGNFAAALLWLAEQGCPARFDLNEIGSSAGINLMMDRYHFDLGGVEVGEASAAMRIKPDWRGDPPPACPVEIVASQGCDVSPVDLTDSAQALRLRAYIWPEFTARFARMDIAIAEAVKSLPQIAHETAVTFVERVLSKPSSPGTTRVIMHSVVWQYIPADQRGAITQMIEAAGESATAEAPLAWVSVEANRDTHRHELRVRFWPGGANEACLSVAHPHGEWIEWGAAG